MPSKKPDRRVRRTHFLLQHALRELIQEKSYEAITVQDILDRADVGRSTFYAHFRNKDDLLVIFFEILYSELDGAMVATRQGRAPTVSDIALAWFQHVEGNRRAFRAIMGGSSWEIVTRRAREHLDGHVREEVWAMVTDERDQEVIDAVADFQAGTLVSLTSWWLEKESTLSPEDMHRLFVTLTRPGMEAVLR